jgi:GT2 family glycosyltransferase
MVPSLPRVSVVIPTYGRPAALARCLAALAELDYPRNRFDVIVVDDGSPSPVGVDAPAVLPLRVIRQPRGGPASARNAGIRTATGEVVAFTDDDCRPEPGWLTALVATMMATPGSGVGGRVVNELTESACAEASQLLVSFLCDYYNDGSGSGARFFTSNNLAFPRQTLLAMGGFDDRYQFAAGEDRELCDRWVGSGRPLVTAKDAVVRHAHHLTLEYFWRQHFTYGRGAWGFRRARADRGGGPVRVEPLSFYTRLLTYPLHVRGVAGLRHSALIGVAQVANATGFAAEAIRRRRGLGASGAKSAEGA